MRATVVGVFGVFGVTEKWHLLAVDRDNRFSGFVAVEHLRLQQTVLVQFLRSIVRRAGFHCPTKHPGCGG